MSHFDLHMHPVFKQAIPRFEDHYPTKRKAEELVGRFDLEHPIPAWLDEHIFHFLESQCCIDQLNKNGAVFGVAAIAPIERFFTNRSGLFGQLLNGSFTDPFDKEYMDRVRDGRISYYQLFLKELGLYRTLAKAGRIRWVTRKDRSALKRTDGINLALGMEGGHALCRTMIGKPGTEDRSLTNTVKDDHTWNDFVGPMAFNPAQNLVRTHNALWKDGMDLLYLTLTHLSHIGDQPLATHAYGMKMLDVPEAYPQGNGITEAGKEVVHAAYDMTQPMDDGKRANTPILIDIKHMGLKSRQDLYDLREQRAKDGKSNPPLLATHMGVTGYSVQAWKDALIGNTARVHHDPRAVGFTIERQTAGEWGLINKKFTFNAWSINLMDEDIVQVLNSNGLIGLSLDVRILGWQDALHKDDVEEFMSTEDFRTHFPQQYARIFNKPLGVESMKPEEDWFKPTKEERHPLALCFNILHVASVGLVAGIASTWERICIGSDYDGLIDPLKNARDAGRFDEVRNVLIRWLPVAEKAYREQHGGPELLERDGSRVDQDKLKKRVDAIIVENGKRFLASW